MINEIVNFLQVTRLFDDTGSRKVIILQAKLNFLLNTMDVSKPIDIFLYELYEKLIGYGKINSEKHSLEALFDVVKEKVGPDKKLFAEKLIKQWKTENDLKTKQNDKMIKVQALQPTPINILHLSDLHFHGTENAILWHSQLAEDLEKIDCKKLDAIILSGDIVYKASEEGYNGAFHFLTELNQDFPVKKENIVIVPGNHDLNRNYPDYKKRFESFSAFFQKMTDKSYEDQYSINHIVDHNLLILGLNSAWEIDKENISKVSINNDSISKALTELRRNKDKYISCLKIAVMHHPLNSNDESHIKDQGFIERLSNLGFKIIIHGHVHKSDNQMFRYQAGSNSIEIIAGGTFGAPSKELVTAYPWQYNIIQVMAEKIEVETRKRDCENGAWKPDARWGDPPQSSYIIKL